MTPSLVAVHVHLHLDGCRSLKERRGRTRGLRQRLGREPGIALCEHPGDDPGESRWTIVALAGTRQAADALLHRIERDLETHVDAVVVDLSREWL